MKLIIGKKLSLLVLQSAHAKQNHLHLKTTSLLAAYNISNFVGLIGFFWGDGGPKN